MEETKKQKTSYKEECEQMESTLQAFQQEIIELQRKLIAALERAQKVGV